MAKIKKTGSSLNPAAKTSDSGFLPAELRSGNSLQAMEGLSSFVCLLPGITVLHNLLQCLKPYFHIISLVFKLFMAVLLY